MCQYDIARPVLNHYGITGLFFIYSSVCQGNFENLEIYRVFRTERFRSVIDFYTAFEEMVHTHLPEIAADSRFQSFRHEEYLKAFPFYSPGDKRFRFLRDDMLGEEKYQMIMDKMIMARGLNKQQLAKGLWMNDANLRALSEEDHMIGLHSYSHPTRLRALPPSMQVSEYQKNYEHIARTIGTAPVTVSHPCNSYDAFTLDILRSMGIAVGFCSNMSEVPRRSQLEFPRQDHTNIMREMRTLHLPRAS